MENQYLNIKIADIEQNENSRVIYKKADLSELMASIRQHGQLQPIGVRKLPSGKYDAVFGNRRIEAMRKLGLDTIDARVVEAEEDKDRDILNMIENLKRTNTTVSEDGRMFCVLRDYGLSIKEIAARLDISENRIETAIDVYREFPKEYRPIIVNRTSGKKISGSINASVAHEISNLRRRYGLNRKKTRALLDFARHEASSIAQLTQIAPLMKEGMSVTEAIRSAKDFVRVNCYYFMSKKEIEKAEKKYGKPIYGCFYDQLRLNPLLQVKKNLKSSYTKSEHHKGGHAAKN